MSSTAIVKTSAESLFPHNPANSYYEEDKKTNTDKIKSAESWICRIGAALPVALIGARIMSEYGIEQVPTDYLTPLFNPALIISTALVVVGLCVTRFKLHRLECHQPIDNSNSISRDQAKEFLARARELLSVKCSVLQDDFAIDRLVEFLEPFEKIDIRAMKLSPKLRQEFQQCIKLLEAFEDKLAPMTKTKAEVENILEVVKRCKDKFENVFLKFYDRIRQRRIEQDAEEMKKKSYSESSIELTTALRKADPCPGLSIKSEWKDTLDDIKRTLKSLLKKAGDVPSATRIYINPEISELISQFQVKREKEDEFIIKELGLAELVTNENAAPVNINNHNN